ncbi:DoxX family protein [Siphonobacter curvatus]|uniref:DoxX family protein n=1 Tax=Siphonobacter curvatus TaxID=2094562 RepID=A0A2S7IM21_9BACT|nr:DoxX family protein [Siphonobacter curvatus]PQA58791.1 DoxX family protein [Siphonobacter curvatus]
MRKLFSISYTLSSINWATLVLRVGTGLLMLPHGYQKLSNYAEKKNEFMSLFGLGSPTSMALAIFAEFFCSILLVLGLFTRVATIPLIITMLVAAFLAHGGEIFGEAELATHYLVAYVTILILGPGDYSLDKVLNKKI